MFVLGNFFWALAIVLRILIYFEMFAVIVSALMSWFPFYHPIRHFFDAMAYPILAPLRRWIPPVYNFDFTPMVAVLILIFLDAFLVKTLMDLAVRLR